MYSPDKELPFIRMVSVLAFDARGPQVQTPVEYIEYNDLVGYLTYIRKVGV